MKGLLVRREKKFSFQKFRMTISQKTAGEKKIEKNFVGREKKKKLIEKERNYVQCDLQRSFKVAG